MKIRYENTLDDLIALQENYHAHSPVVRRQVAGWEWGGAATILLGVLLLLPVLTPSPPGMTGLPCPTLLRQR